jgi:orotate phosphoribosyltransferase
MNQSHARILAEKLLQIKAIKLNPQNPYTWASGIRSPIYCDNRVALSYPAVRNLIRDGLTHLAKQHYSEANCIAGVATAGIPHASLVANELNLPLVYVRSKAKEHGRKNLIEGKLPPEAKVIVVEDLISTGMSSLAAVEKIREENATILSVIAIFTYALEKSFQQFDSHQCELKTLLDYPTLIEVAREQQYISSEEMEILEKWRENPNDFLIS